MITSKEIDTFVEELARRFDPEQVVLFGSYAQGTSTPYSDVDLLVIMSHKRNAADEALAIRQHIDCPFPLDLIVKSPEEIRRRLSLKDMFLTTVLRQGQMLYERGR